MTLRPRRHLDPSGSEPAERLNYPTGWWARELHQPLALLINKVRRNELIVSYGDFLHESSATPYQQRFEFTARFQGIDPTSFQNRLEGAYSNEFPGNRFHETNERARIWALWAKYYQVSLSGSPAPFALRRPPSPPLRNPSSRPS